MASWLVKKLLPAAIAGLGIATAACVPEYELDEAKEQIANLEATVVAQQGQIQGLQQQASSKGLIAQQLSIGQIYAPEETEIVSSYLEGIQIAVHRTRQSSFNELQVRFFPLETQECRDLLQTFGKQQALLTYLANISQVFAKYPAQGVIQQGLWAGFYGPNTIITMDPSVIWANLRSPFHPIKALGVIRLSNESVETLEKIGRDIRDNACNAPEKTSLHRQLNPHMYSANGTLKPHYAPKKTGMQA
ncbi:hypothetical protein HYU17_01620 [Candidatus Woesearchaeota archaeon]|nr:hypothetical protein [Candidatus Woesearchaeota archaeon]